MKNQIIKNLCAFGCAAAMVMTTLAQGGSTAQQERPSSKGAVIKGKAPVNKDVLKVTLPKPYETKLSNGLQVVVLENHKLPTFSMRMVVLRGGLSDSDENLGVAEYAASTLREGTTTRNSQQIAEAVDSLGASLDASAGLTSTTTTVSAAGLIENFDKIMALFGDVILNPTFPADELNKLKQRAIGALGFQRSDPGFLGGEKMAQVLYGKHPGGRYFINADQINAITPEKLKAFHAAAFKPNNAIFAIVGDVNPLEVVAKLEKTFANWKAGEVAATTIPHVPPVAVTKVYLVDRPGSVQTNLVLGVPTIERNDPDYFALEMMNQVVGGGASARLFLNLREDKGYTYGAYSSSNSGKYRGSYQATAEVRTEVTKGALDEFMKELNRIRTEPVAADEFDRARRTIVGGWARQLEFPNSLLSNIVTAKLYNFPADYYDTYPAKIAAVTPADVQRVAQKYLTLDRLAIVAVGDAEKIKKDLAAFGPVEATDSDGKPLVDAANKPAVAPGLTGFWTLMLESPQGQVPIKVEFKESTGAVTGSLDTPFGKFPISSGSLAGDDVKFKAKIEVQGNALELSGAGKLENGFTMKGELSSDMTGAMKFTGKKEK
jgi:predicted Zn-dependent peptidase